MRLRHLRPRRQFLAIALAVSGTALLGSNLAYYEEVKDIYLHPATFTVQSGLLSASGLLMRQKLVKYFMPQLEDMYKRLD